MGGIYIYIDPLKVEIYCGVDRLTGDPSVFLVEFLDVEGSYTSPVFCLVFPSIFEDFGGFSRIFGPFPPACRL